MEDVEVMKQLRTMITEWNAVDEQLVPAKFDILLRCSDMEQNLDVHCFRHCGEHKRAMCACLESRQLQILMRDCHRHAQYVWETIGNDHPIRVMCISDGMHWAQAVQTAGSLQAGKLYQPKAVPRVRTRLEPGHVPFMEKASVGKTC